MRTIRARALLIGVTTDVLIPVSEIDELSDAFVQAGRPAERLILDIETGHDSFLIHPDAFGPPIANFLAAELQP